MPQPVDFTSVVDLPETFQQRLATSNVAYTSLDFLIELRHGPVFHDHRVTRRAPVKPEHLHVKIHTNGRGKFAGWICPHAQARGRGPSGIAPLAHDMYVVDCQADNLFDALFKIGILVRIKDGTWADEQVGVKAPGRPNKMIFRPAVNAAMVVSSGPSSPIRRSTASGSLSPCDIAILVFLRWLKIIKP